MTKRKSKKDRILDILQSISNDLNPLRKILDLLVKHYLELMKIEQNKNWMNNWWIYCRW